MNKLRRNLLQNLFFVLLVGLELSNMFGHSVTCHLGNLLRVVKRHLQEQRITAQERLLTDNELLARWVGGLYDDFLSQLRSVDRKPIRFLPAAQSFSRTLFFWAQHRDVSIDAFVRCLRPDVFVRTIVWVREPVERFFSTFYYAKYVRGKSCNLLGKLRPHAHNVIPNTYP